MPAAAACPFPDLPPPAPVFNAETTALVTAFPHAAVDDADGDGVLSDADFHAFVLRAFAEIVVDDLDEDGNITAGDEMDALSGFIDRLSDKGRIPGRGLLGPSRLACEAAFDVLVNTAGTMTFEVFNRGHMATVSRQLPGHQVTTSRSPAWAPANHERSISLGWFDGDAEPDPAAEPLHGVADSRRWPAQHLVGVSETWAAGQPGHHITNSRFWPASHSRGVSDTWTRHVDVLTGQSYPPDQGLRTSLTHHNSTISAWNPGNEPPPGFMPDPGRRWRWPLSGDHAATVSATWVPLEHAETVSVMVWMPGHAGAVSMGWTASHLAEYSRRWRASHHVDVSNTWRPTTADFPLWPNHEGMLSARYMQMTATGRPLREVGVPTWSDPVFTDTHRVDDSGKALKDWKPEP